MCRINTSFLLCALRPTEHSLAYMYPHLGGVDLPADAADDRLLGGRGSARYDDADSLPSPRMSAGPAVAASLLLNRIRCFVRTHWTCLWWITLVYHAVLFVAVCMNARLAFSMLSGISASKAVELPYTKFSFDVADNFTAATDPEFWSLFPCGREEYAVWHPDNNEFAHPASSTIPGERGGGEGECQSLVVSAFFDIGRDRWDAYQRSTFMYLEHSDHVLQIRNPMVIFTTPDLAPRFVKKRREAGLMERTMVVGMNQHCMPRAWLLKTSAQLMSDPSFFFMNWFGNTPERTQPWYNIVMWAKVGFFKAAASINFPAVYRGERLLCSAPPPSHPPNTHC